MTDRDAVLRELMKKRIVYRPTGVDAITVRRDEPYRLAGGGSLKMDVYLPPEMTADKRVPVVVIVMGYPDPEGHYRRMGWAISWAQLLAVSGVAAVIYGTREPAADIHAVIGHLRREAASYGIDEHRIGILAASANVVVALSALMQDPSLRCGALLYGYTMDLDGSTAVAEAAAQYGFVNACAGKSVDDLPVDLPLFLVRSGRDQFPGLMEGIDRFVSKALARNLPVTLVNHHTSPHAFDLDDDSDTSRDIIRQALSFLRLYLGASGLSADVFSA